MKKLLTLLLILIITVFTFTGCVPINENGNYVYKVNDDITFINIVDSENDDESYFKIFVHKETRVMYIYFSSGGGFSVMLDQNGKPLIWRGNL